MIYWSRVVCLSNFRSRWFFIGSGGVTQTDNYQTNKGITTVCVRHVDSITKHTSKNKNTLTPVSRGFETIRREYPAAEGTLTFRT